MQIDASVTHISWEWQREKFKTISVYLLAPDWFKHLLPGNQKTLLKDILSWLKFHQDTLAKVWQTCNLLSKTRKQGEGGDEMKWLGPLNI